MAPYITPTIPTINTSQTIFVNPASATHGNGTEGSPWNNIPGGSSTLYENTRFRIKCGTTLNQYVSRRFVNCIIDSYDVGARPIINQGIMLNPPGGSVIIADIDVKRQSFWSGGWDAVINIGSTSGGYTDVTITNCIIEGLRNTALERWFPNYGIKTDNNCHRLIAYNNIIRNIWRDGITVGFADDMKIVKNWFHELNKESEKTWLTGGGDAVEIRAGSKNLYLAGNLMDKSGTPWKFSLIHNDLSINPNQYTSANRGIIIEHNTIIGPINSSAGGGVIFYNFPTETIFRKNIVDSTNKGLQSGQVPLSLGSVNLQNHLLEVSPYGIHQNHLIKTAGGDYTWTNYDSSINPSNQLHNGYAAYQSYMTANPLNDWGSDIDPATFLGVPESIPINIEIIGGGTVTKNPDKELYVPGESVQLTATPQAGKTFGGWGGSVVSVENPVTIIAS